MIVEAPQEFINYVEKSANFLNCPTHIFNHDLNSTYRQFYYDGEPRIIKQLATVLYTFGYNKTKSFKIAKELYNFYESISTQEFMKINVNWSNDEIPRKMLDRNKQISDFIESGKRYYPNGILAFTPSYPFKRGYSLKLL